MRAALSQATTGIDPAESAVALTAAIAAAKEGAADMLFTPEMSNVLDRDRARAAGSIVSEDEDRVLAAACEGAARTGVWVQLGSLALKGGAGGRNINRSFLIDGSGAIRARYDKIHLFDVDLPGGIRWRESEAYAAGDRAVVADTPWGRIGLSVCYDLRFPDLFRALTDAGATMLAIPAAFTVPTGQAHWHILLRARAIEAGVFVIAAGQVGHHADGRDTYGHSLAIDPWGGVVLDMAERQGIGFADLEFSQIDTVRVRIPAIHHRRPFGTVVVAS